MTLLKILVMDKKAGEEQDPTGGWSKGIFVLPNPD